jgi:hypothetical protein
MFPLGGGIYNQGTLSVRNCTISGNSATGRGLGGGISNDARTGSGVLTIDSSSVTGNSASVGGGIYSSGNTTVTVTNCTISGNTATGTSGTAASGGGIFNDGTALATNLTAALIVSNSTLSGNSATSHDGEGGAIYNDGSLGHATVSVKNSTLSGNSAVLHGSGIVNVRGGNNSTPNSATLTIGSTILKAGASGENIYNLDGAITSLGYNLSSDAAGGDATTGPGGPFLNQPGDIRNTDPMLGGLQNNGGPTFTHALVCGGPAVDRGKNFDSLTTDQRGTGFNRTVGFPAATGGDATDIGAFEVQAVCDNPPDIKSEGTIFRQQGGPSVNTSIAEVLDSEQSANTLTVTVNGGSSATVNGVTVSNIAINSGGRVSADVAADCSASNATFTLRATDDTGHFDEDTLTVNVTANPAPILTYGSTSVANGGSTMIDPTTATDNGSITGYSVQSVVPALMTAPTVNSGGVVSITNAQPAGMHTVTIRATDDCGMVTDASFTLTVDKGDQTITFGALPNKTFGDPDFSVSATATSGLPVSFAASGNCTVTTPSPGTVHLTGAGLCTITASQAGNINYNAAPNVPQSFTIAKAVTTTAVSSSSNPSATGQNVTFTATVTSAAGTPTGTVQFKDGGANLGLAVTLNSSGVATLSTSSLSAGVHTITAEYNGDDNFLASGGTLSGDQQVGSIIKFSVSSYNTTENSGFTTIIVQRTGDLSQAVTVDYSTPDDSSAMTVLPCATANGVAFPRCDFETALGTLRWAAGDGAAKTFTVLINQDNFVEGPETLTLTLSDPTGGAGFTTPGATSLTATLTIDDDATEPATNPIDDTDTFVRQHYRDFLNREPDASGLQFWKDNIDKCNDPARRPAGLTTAHCIELFRINTSAAFFLSIEFQNEGYFVERMYKAAFGDISPPTVPVPVRFTNFIGDTQTVGAGVSVGQGNWQTQLDNNQNAFALQFVQRPAFLNRYPALTSATAFVDSLNGNAGSVLSDTERSALISELSANPSDPSLRADVLKKVADNATLQQREFNRAFVLMEYFGYLRRNPDAAPEQNFNFDGYNFWLNKLNQFNGDFIKAEMIRAFISSGEYRQRFGP